MAVSPPILEALQSGLAFHRAGQLDAAEAKYRIVLAQDKKNADALNLMGLIHQARGQHERALTLFDKALKAAPTLASASYNKALTCDALKRPVDAEAAYRKAIAMRIDYADAYLNLGALLHRVGGLDEAVAIFQAMTAQCPADARGHYNLGYVLAEQRQFAAAETALRAALALNPAYVDAMITLAKVLADTARLPMAVEMARKAVELAPTNANALTNLGTYLADIDDHAAAIEAYSRALQADPGYASARTNRGLARLVCGQLAEGWDDYAVRAASDGTFKFRKLDLPWPQWQGESLTGQRLLVWGEQGLGDEILFAGLLPQLVAAAQSCVFGCSPRLVALFRRSFPGATILPLDEVLQSQGSWSFDYQSSLNDLGRWLRRSFAAFPNRSQYLQADAKRAAEFRQKYLASQPPGTKLVGVSWRSLAPHVGDQKTPPLAMWARFRRTTPVRYISLQYRRLPAGLGPVAMLDSLAQECLALEKALAAPVAIDPDFETGNDLDILAAQVRAMDEVTTVSNTTAHLAGGLGVPAQILVPGGKARLWYWFKNGQYSPWYPSVRLIRWSAEDAGRFASAY